MNSYLFFDTETTGLPRNYSAPVNDLGNWPRIVQLAWLLTDADGTVQSKGNHIVKPEGFQIPKGMVHGITHKQALREGVAIDVALTDFLHDTASAGALVCHNADFDTPIVGAEFIRAGSRNPLAHMRVFCTQKQTTEWAQIPKKGSRHQAFKWPSLLELHRLCTGEDFTGAHDAMSDVHATARCFFHIKQHSPGVFAFPYR